jgi:hypothetical protein
MFKSLRASADEVDGIAKPFAAARSVAIGTKLASRDDPLLVRFRGEADMHDGVASASSDVDDPSTTSARNFCCDAQRRSCATVW